MIERWGSTQEYLAHVKAVKARLYAPRPEVVPAPASVVAPVVTAPAPEPVAPLWMWGHVVYDHPRQQPAPEQRSARRIIGAVCSVFEVNADYLKGERRTADIVRPRQVAMYLLRQDTRLSLPQIGRALGGRDHTTALSGIRKIERLLREGDAVASGLAEKIAACRALYGEVQG